MKAPAYKRIQQHILADIECGKLKHGEQIPTELSLAKQFSVSRMTVNKAIVGLSEKNILTRRAGKGTFVTQHKNELPLMQTVDFSEEVKARGNTYHANVLVHEKRPIYDDDAVRLGVANATLAGYCEVLHFENNVPLIIETRFVNTTHAIDFMAQDFTQITPTAYLLKGYPLTEIEHTVEAIIPPKTVHRQLNLPAQSPCLQILRRTWSNNVLISYTRLITAGDAYRLQARYRV